MKLVPVLIACARTGMRIRSRTISRPSRSRLSTWTSRSDSGCSGSTTRSSREIANTIQPVSPRGDALILGVEDLQAQTHQKAMHARAAIEATDQLLALDLLTGAHWMDVRAKQDPHRAFGRVPTDVRRALRAVVPFDQGTALPPRPIGVTATTFMRLHPAASFTSGNLP